MKYNPLKLKTKKPSISFFCPAYNDEKNLRLLIPKTINLLKSVAWVFEVVIIDDASRDKTGNVADDLAKRYAPYVRVVHHKKNRDYGGAIRSGFTTANKYEYIFYTDGDNQYDVNELKKMLEYVPTYDAVIGVRKKPAITLMRIIQSKLYNWMVQSLFHIDSEDVGCALRLIKQKYIAQIHFYSASSFVQVEVLLGLKDLGAKIKQIPVNHSPRKYGKASGGNPNVILHTVTDLVKAYFRRILPTKRNCIKYCARLLFTLGFILIGLEVLARFGILSSELFRTQQSIKTLHAPKKILLIGDSFTSEYENSYALRLRLWLESQDVSVLNQAVPGDGPELYLQRTERYIGDYKPNIIIVNYYVGNDLTDTLYKLNQPQKWYRKLEPKLEFSYLFWYVREQLNGLITQNRLRWLVQNPTLPTLPEQIKTIRNPTLYAVAQKYPQHLLENLLIETPEAKSAWQKNQEYMEKIAAICNKYKAKLLIISMPNTLQVNNSHLPFYKSIGFTLDEKLLTTTTPQNLLSQYCTKYQLSCLDLLPEFKATPAAEYYLNNDDHWNEAGNKLAFEQVSSFLLPLIH